MSDVIDAVLAPALLRLGDWSIRWAVLIAGLGVWLAVCRPRNAAVRMAVFRLVLVGGLLLPLIPHYWGPSLRSPQPLAPSVDPPTPEEPSPTPPAPLPDAPLHSIVDSKPDDLALTRLSPQSPVPLSAPQMETPRSAEPSPSPMERGHVVVLSIAGLWSLGVLAFSIRLAVGWLWLAWLRRQATPASPQSRAMLDRHTNQLGIRRRVSLLTHPAMRSPALVGGFRPCILLPVWWAELPEPTREVSLLHELTHLSRGDDWARLVEEIVRVVFFFHPFVLWLLNRLNGESERLCDALLVRRGADPRTLARVLLDFSQRQRPGHSAFFFGAALPFFHRVNVKDRIHQLLENDMQRWASPFHRRARALTSLAVLSIALSVGSFGVRAHSAVPATPSDVNSGGPVLARPTQTSPPNDPGYSASEEPTAPKEATPQARGESDQNVEQSIQQCIERLTSVQAEQRVQAAKELARLGPKGKQAAPALRNALKDTDARVRIRAAEALYRIDKDLQAALPVLYAVRASNDARVRDEAETVLKTVGVGVRAVMPYVTELAKKSDSDAQHNAIATLRKFKLEAVPALVDALVEASDSEIPEPAPVRPVPIGRRATGKQPLLLKSLREFMEEALARVGATAVPTYTEILHDRNARLRARMAGVLGRMGREAEQALPTLVDCLRDPEKEVRRSAAVGVGRVGKRNPAARAALIGCTKDQDPEVRRYAVIGLERLGGATDLISPVLVPMLRDPEPQVRLTAADGLCRLDNQNKEAMTVLADGVREPDHRSRELAAAVLLNLGQKAERAIPSLLQSLAEKDPVVRSLAATTLGAVGSANRKAVLPALEQSLKDHESVVRREALAAIVRITPDAKALVALCVPLLGDPDPLVRVRAAGALVAAGNVEEAVPVLLRIASEVSDVAAGQSVSDESRQLLVQAGKKNPAILSLLIAELKDPKGKGRDVALLTLRDLALPAGSPLSSQLLDLLKAEDPRVRAAAVNVLANAADLPRDAGRRVLAALDNLDRESRLSGLRLLIRLGVTGPDVSTMLGIVLKDPDQEIRRQALFTLGTAGPASPDVAVALANALRDPYEPNRNLAAHFLKALGQNVKPAIPRLSELITDPDEKARLQAIDVLRAIGYASNDALPVLKHLLKAKDASVRAQAAELLLGMDGTAPEASSALIELTKDKDPGTRRRAFQALASMPRGKAKAIASYVTTALKDSDPDIRLEAALVLVETNRAGGDAAPILRELLKDADAGRRYKAAKALLQLRAEPLRIAAEVLAESLEVADAEQQLQTIQLLGRAGGHSATLAVPALINLIRDPDTPVRRMAIITARLFWANKKELIPALVDVIRNADEYEHYYNAIEDLELYGPDAIAAALPELVEMLADPDEIPRFRGWQALSVVGPQRLATVVPELISIMKSGSPPARALAARVAARLEPQAGRQAVSTLVEMLRDPDAEVSIRAASALGHLAPTEARAAVPMLKAHLREGPPEIRIAAAGALAQCGPDEAQKAVPLLLEFLRDPDDEIWQRAAQALSQGGVVIPKAAFPEIMKMLQTPRTRHRTAQILARVDPRGLEEALPELTEMLNDRQVRLVAVQVLGRMGPAARPAIPAILESMKNADAGFKGIAVQVVSRLSGDKEAVPALIKLLKDPQRRLLAVQMLGRMGPAAKPAVPAIVETMKNADPAFKSAALQALSQLGGNDNTVPELIELLKDPGQRLQAVQILGRMGPAAKSAVPAVIQAMKDGTSGFRLIALQMLPRMGADPKEMEGVLSESMKDPALRRIAQQIKQRRP
jgi:HEAT repeat protein/beta-lactamase regulating signal transducer with metallopeptidase domain